MNKKHLIKFVTILVSIIVIVFIWLLISFWRGHKAGNMPPSAKPGSSQQYPTAREEADWNKPFMKKIKVEFMDGKEKEKAGLANDPMTRLQILERDKNGNVAAYKKISSDSDIVEYVYDPNGAGSGTSEEK